MLEKLFKLKENKTDVRTEVVAGITTFMTMAYILAVNPSVLSAAGMDHGAVFTATAIAACIGTLLMALFANYPFALAPGMGLNAYFAYTVVLNMGYTWQVALAFPWCVKYPRQQTGRHLHMAGGACGCICGRNYFYSVISYECA